MRILLALVVAAAMSLPALATATEERLPWWVADEAAAGALRGALASLWSGHPMDVRVGEPDLFLDGVHVRGEDVVLFLDGAEERLTSGPEPAVQVTLVRARLRRWAAEEEASAASDAQPRARRRLKTRPGPFIVGGLGAGGRAQRAFAGNGAPSLNLRLGGGVEGRFWTLGAVAAVKVGDRARVGVADFSGQAVFLGGSGTIRAVTPPDVVVEVGIGGGVRLVTWSTGTAPVVELGGVLPGLDVSLLVWSPSRGRVSLGGGARIEIDLRTLVLGVGGTDATLAPASFVFEFVTRIGGASDFFEGFSDSRHEGS